MFSGTCTNSPECEKTSTELFSLLRNESVRLWNRLWIILCGRGACRKLLERTTSQAFFLYNIAFVGRHTCQVKCLSILHGSCQQLSVRHTCANIGPDSIHYDLHISRSSQLILGNNIPFSIVHTKGDPRLVDLLIYFTEREISAKGWPASWHRSSCAKSYSILSIQVIKVLFQEEHICLRLDCRVDIF